MIPMIPPELQMLAGLAIAFFLAALIATLVNK